MTVITKHSAIIKNPIITDGSLPEKPIIAEEKIEIYPELQTELNKSNVKLIPVVAIIFLAFCLISGLILCRNMEKKTPVQPHQSPCGLGANDETELRRWYPDGTLEVATFVEGPRSMPIEARMQEKINIKDNVETLTIISDGLVYNFIHDFNANTSGIVDDERCFLMELTPELVMAPALFITRLTAVVTDPEPVRSELVAQLPALPELRRAAASLASACGARPAYRLYRARRDAIRKRSAEDRFEVDYMQLAGNHVEQIRIVNLAELVEYEKKMKA